MPTVVASVSRPWRTPRQKRTREEERERERERARERELEYRWEHREESGAFYRTASTAVKVLRHEGTALQALNSTVNASSSVRLPWSQGTGGWWICAPYPSRRILQTPLPSCVPGLGSRLYKQLRVCQHQGQLYKAGRSC